MIHVLRWNDIHFRLFSSICRVDCDAFHLFRCMLSTCSGWACLQKCGLGLGRGFLAGYATKAVINAVFIAISKRSATAALKAFTGSDAIRFGAFLGGLVGISSGTRCALAHIRGRDDRLNALIAGIVHLASYLLHLASRFALSAWVRLILPKLRVDRVGTAVLGGRWLHLLPSSVIEYHGMRYTRGWCDFSCIVAFRGG